MMVPGKEVSGEADTLEKIRKRIQALNETFNQESGKPYYVELSIGGVQMVCGSSLALDKVLSGADEKLYEAKEQEKTVQHKIKEKRKSVWTGFVRLYMQKKP